MRNSLYILGIFYSVILVSSCGGDAEKQVAQDHKAYHNPAVESYTVAIQTDSANASLYYKRSLALYNINMEELALKDLEKAVVLDPQNDVFWSAKGELLNILEKHDQAVLAFKKAFELKPRELKYNLAIANSLLLSNKVEQSRNIVDKILQVAPNYPDAYYLQAQIEAAGKDTLKAETLLKKALQIDPYYYEASLLLGEYYAEQKNKMAIRQYEYTYELEPSDVYPLFQIGYFYEMQHDTPKAKEAYMKCILANRDYTDAYMQMGKILLQQDSAEKAKRNLLLAVATEPASSNAHYWLGMAYEKLNNADSARLQYANAAGLNPENSKAKEAVQRLKK